jgi:hypothetical protein
MIDISIKDYRTFSKANVKRMSEELRGIRIELEQKDLTVDQSATAAVSLENMDFRSGVFASHFPAERGSSALRKSRATSQLVLNLDYTH